MGDGFVHPFGEETALNPRDVGGGVVFAVFSLKIPVKVPTEGGRSVRDGTPLGVFDRVDIVPFRSTARGEKIARNAVGEGERLDLAHRTQKFFSRVTAPCLGREGIHIPDLVHEGLGDQLGRRVRAVGIAYHVVGVRLHPLFRRVERNARKNVGVGADFEQGLRLAAEVVERVRDQPPRVADEEEETDPRLSEGAVILFVH